MLFEKLLIKYQKNETKLKDFQLFCWSSFFVFLKLLVPEMALKKLFCWIFQGLNQKFIALFTTKLRLTFYNKVYTTKHTASIF